MVSSFIGPKQFHKEKGKQQVIQTFKHQQRFIRKCEKRAEKPSLKTLSCFAIIPQFQFSWHSIKFVQISVVRFNKTSRPFSRINVKHQRLCARTFYSNPCSTSTSPTQYHTSHLSGQQFFRVNKFHLCPITCSIKYLTCLSSRPSLPSRLGDSSCRCPCPLCPWRKMC